jgi:hypothetical protein
MINKADIIKFFQPVQNFVKREKDELTQDVTDEVILSGNKEKQAQPVLLKSPGGSAREPEEADKSNNKQEQHLSTLRHFIDNGMNDESQPGVYKKHLAFLPAKISEPEKALKKLDKNGSLYVMNERNNFSKISSHKDLEVLDQLMGAGESKSLSEPQYNALTFLKEGKDEDDGITTPGFFTGKTLNTYDTYKRLEKGKTTRVNIGDRERLEAKKIDDLVTINVLYGGGENTILPENERDALLYLEKGKDSDDGLYVKGKRSPVNSYDAFQELQDNKKVSVNIGHMEKLVAKDTEDLAEINSFYGEEKNTVLTDREYKAFKYLEKGKSKENGFYDAEGLTNAYYALQTIQDGTGTMVNIGNKTNLMAKTTQDIVEIDTFYGSGENTILPEDQFQSFKYFDKLGNFQAYEALNDMQEGKPVVINHKGISDVLRNPENVKELDSLEGRGVNTILPDDQYKNLQDMKQYFCQSESQPSGKMSSYGALQKFKTGEPVDFSMTGGDFDRPLMDKLGKIEDIPKGLQKIANQKEYDKYRFTVPEYKDKAEKENKKSPGLIKKDQEQAKTGIAKQKNNIEYARYSIDMAESDRERGERDKKDAEDDLRKAKRMPDTVWEYGYHYGHNPQTGSYDYHYGYHNANNDDKDRAIRKAKRDISDAESKIRRAERELREAQNKLESSQNALKREEVRLANGIKIDQEMIPELMSIYSSINAEHFNEIKDSLAGVIAQLTDTAKYCGENVRENIDNQGKLLAIMDERPERPAGWTPPEPRWE